MQVGSQVQWEAGVGTGHLMGSSSAALPVPRRLHPFAPSLRAKGLKRTEGNSDGQRTGLGWGRWN